MPRYRMIMPSRAMFAGMQSGEVTMSDTVDPAIAS
jgi:hypothetical protein